LRRQEVTAIRKELLEAGKDQCANGIISNFRADYLTEESRKYQDKQREIAGLRGKTRIYRIRRLFQKLANQNQNQS
jgi:hypothetical protein